MKIDLTGMKWHMKGFWPYTPLFGRSVETGASMGQVTGWLPARIPGCVHSDLLANGIIDEPYYEMNSLKCEWVENRWWVYKTEFELELCCAGQNMELVFLGIDYKCHIFLNNVKLCEHEGMFEPVRLDITGKAMFGCSNILEIVLESAPDEMGQIGHTSMVRTQKSRFGYKWDFATRLVHTGIWDDVYLHVYPGARIENTYAATSLAGQNGIVDIEVSLKLAAAQEYRLTAALSLDGRVVAEHIVELQPDWPEVNPAKIRLMVENPCLWWPNGHGGQPLYDVDIRLFQQEYLCDSYRCRLGIRSLKYGCNDGATGSLPYVAIINGKRIYIKGVNMTPLDHMIGAVTEERYARVLKLAKDANVNLVRVWGGGIIEREAYYNLCDEYGIMVWQEFNQSSSGIDNVPPKDKGFLELLQKNAKAAILGRRNHVSLTFWSGGNELMDWDGVPATYQDENIAMLKELVNSQDPGRLFLPTSASGPSEFLNVSPEGLGRNHDVHGPWQYQGTEKHYEMYNQSDSLLHSEFGVDGCTNFSAIGKFLSVENRMISNVAENIVWRHHGEWWDTTGRDKDVFGEPDSLESMVLHSQYIQAEGLRYAIESNRRRAFHNSGSIVWQFNEPWPNLFCTSLIDYFLQPKMAYSYVKRAYAPLAVSLAYNKLGYLAGELFLGSVWLVDDARAFEGCISFKVFDLCGKILSDGKHHVECSGRHSVSAGVIRYTVDDVPGGIFLIELSIDGRGDEYSNLYMFSHKEPPIFSALPSSMFKSGVIPQL